MVGPPAQLTDIESSSYIVGINLSAASRRKDAVLHGNVIHIRNPGGGGTHNIQCADCTVSRNQKNRYDGGTYDPTQASGRSIEKRIT